MAEHIDDGRRIYIHERSLGNYARHDTAWGYMASLALSDVRVAKVAHHHLSQGVEIGAMRPETADRVLEPIREARQRGLESILQTTGYQPRIPYRPERTLPILNPGEQVADTCFQDGYYTFATSRQAADRMFADRVPMRQLRAGIGAGEGPHDLTIISSQLSPMYEHGLEGNGQTADQNDYDIRASVASTLTHHLEEQSAELSLELTEEMILSDFMRAAAVTLERPNF